MDINTNRYITIQERKKNSQRKFLEILVGSFVIIIFGIILNNVFLKHSPTQYYKSINYNDDGKTITTTLVYVGPNNYYYNKNNSRIIQINLQIIRNGQKSLIIRMGDNKNGKRFALPDSPYFLNKKFNHQNKIQDPNLDYIVSIRNTKGQYCLSIVRSSTSQTIFNTSNLPFIYSDKYIYFASRFQNKSLWGLGQRTSKKFMYQSGNYTLWNQYNQDFSFDKQGSGYHPMYLARENSGKWHIVFLRTSGGIRFQYKKNQSLAFNQMGGIVQMQFFLSDTPKNVIKMYHQRIGGYKLHPFWASGYHQSRYGYNNGQSLINVFNEFNKYQIPLDAIWSDSQYMNLNQVFTINKLNFNVAQLQNKIFGNPENLGIKWIPKIDFGIYTNYEWGSGYIYKNYKKRIFIFSENTNQQVVGCTQAGAVYFPDFNSNDTWNYFKSGLNNLYYKQNLTYDGLWFSNNQVNNIISGQLTGNTKGICNYSNKIDNNQQYNDLPIFLDSTNQQNYLTLPLNSYHVSNQNSTLIPNLGNISQFDFHNINALGQVAATASIVEQQNWQNFLLMSRSTFPGSGKYSGHINQDNQSTNDYLNSSLISVFNAQLFGIPFSGTPICGFKLNATAQLCARWYSLASMYPFAWNHNNNDTVSQQPYAFPTSSYVFQAAIKSLRLRYRLLKHYYTIFSQNQGFGSIFNPLFIQFPEDLEVLKIQSQAIIGQSLLLTPVLDINNDYANFTKINAYFPDDEWYPLLGNQSIIGPGYQTLIVNFNSQCPIFLRSGYLIGIQNISMQDGHYITRTYQLNNIFSLMIALQKFGQYSYGAYGYMISLSNLTTYDQNCGGTIDCVIDIYINGKLAQNNKQLNLTINYDIDSISEQVELNLIINKLEIGIGGNWKRFDIDWMVGRNNTIRQFVFEI